MNQTTAQQEQTGAAGPAGSASTRGRVVIASPRAHRTEWSRGWRKFRRYRPGVVAAGFILLLCVVALAAPLLAPYSPYDVDTARRGEGPSLAHPLGFDGIGRDILSRVIYGARVALLVGLIATGIAVSIGVTVGATAGYFGGWVDSLLSRVVDTLMAFPTLVLLITLSAVLGPSLKIVVIIIGTTVWAQYARVVRADVLSLRERDFVQAARAAGATDSRIIFRHIVPNVLGPVIVIATLGIGGIIILEAALSFLGLGIQAPKASWGGDLSAARSHIRNFPHIAIAPGVLITITVLAFNLVGDGLRDALDPRQKD
jgi:ABC-type dipeptide/oligopeptide/nickel transport system permease subunit